MNDISISPVWQPKVQQGAFRELMNAFSEPGKVADFSQIAGQVDALTLVLATLLDAEVTFADQQQLISSLDSIRVESKKESPDLADYVVLNGNLKTDFTPRLGTLESPELGTTLVLRVRMVGDGDTALVLSGPGVATQRTLMVDGFDNDWIVARHDWNASFPLGVDFILVDDKRAVALPRTTLIKIQGAC